jgi:phenylacetate-CoA ligase
MTTHFDELETRAPDVRERETFDALRKLLARSLTRLPALAPGSAIPIPPASPTARRWRSCRFCASRT